MKPSSRNRQLGTVRVAGKRIPVRRRSLPRNLWGFTYLDDPEPEIQVSSRLRSSRSVLITTLHEMLHHLRPAEREQAILRLEQDLTRLMAGNKTFFRNLIRSL